MNLQRKVSKGIRDPKLIIRKIRSGLRPYNYRLLDGYALLPSRVYININNKCNMRCKMCDYGQRKETNFSLNLGTEEELDIKEWQVFLDDVRSFRPTIAITGTEPLLYPNLIEFIRQCKENKLSIEITTNGYLLSDYAKDIASLQVNKIFVSIDGPEAVHNEIRGVKDAFMKVKNGIRKILELKQSDKPSIAINCTISNLNYRYLENTLQALKGMYDTFLFSHLDFVTEGMANIHNEAWRNVCLATSSTISDEIDPKKVDISVLYAQIERIKKNFSKAHFNPDLSRSQLTRYYREPLLFINGFDRCYVPWKVGQVLANGDVVVSTRCFRIIFGNIREQRFTEIWNSKIFLKFREKLKEVSAFPACTRCCGIFSPL